MTEATQGEASDLQACRELLSQAKLSYVRHEEGRREPFNVFTVLRSESDEVRLHSRFLAALLDHRKAPGEPRENLKDFLKDVVDCSDFDLDGVTVERERDNIDILVSSTARQAVVIENKIWTGDQPEQLQKYHGSLRERGFEDRNIHLLYLTPHGHDPSEDSKGSLDAARIACISYAHTLPPWLERCRERACGEPELRESIAQYLHLARKLTGTDRGREYMNELKGLWQTNNYLALSHDLGKAAIEAKLDLFSKLFRNVSESKAITFKKQLDRSHDEAGFIEQGRGGSSYVALRWNLTGKYEGKGQLWVSTHEAYMKNQRIQSEGLYLCIAYTKKQNPGEFEEIKNALRDVGIGHHGDEWDWRPWCRYPWKELNLFNPSLKYVEILSDDKRRRELAEEIANMLNEAWQTVHASA